MFSESAIATPVVRMKATAMIHRLTRKIRSRSGSASWSREDIGWLSAPTLLIGESHNLSFRVKPPPGIRFTSMRVKRPPWRNGRVLVPR